ncbi:FAD-dependent monooxygenase [Saccharopolyspora sp. NPDC002578]
MVDDADTTEQHGDPTVLVVGAGPTGLALACGLRRRGISVRVVDKANGPVTTSRALGVQPRGVEVLMRLGALSDLPDQVLPLREVRMYAGGELTSSMPMDRMGTASGRSPLLVSQVEVERALRERAADLGVRPEWGCELADFDADDTGVTATVRDDRGARTVRTGWLVGADGAHSAVRKLAGIGFPGVRVAEHFLIADVRASWPLDRQVMCSWSRGGDMVSVCPLPGADRWRLMGPAPEGTAGELDDDGILALVEQQLTRCTPHPREGIDRVDWLSSFRIHRRLVDTYRQGRVLLAGDAVAIHHPFGGQGMNTGLGDAENLAWKLALVAENRAGDALLDSYEAERRRVVSGVLKSTRFATWLVNGEGRVVTFVRERVVMPLMNTARVQNFLWRNASQLGVHYRGGPLAARWRGRGSGPRPGERVADVVCSQEDGSLVRLHEALQGRWALLSGPGEDASLAVAADLLGDGGVVRLTPREGRFTGIWLVRPDAHLAWRGAAAPVEMSRWLAESLDRSGLRTSAEMKEAADDAVHVAHPHQG